MVEKIVENQVLFYFAGMTVLLGIILKLLVGISLKRLVKAASNMSKSNHTLMRLVRAKFEHACMVSDKVQNVPAFVEKYLYEYKIFAFRLSGLRQTEWTMIWLCACTCAVGGVLAYSAGKSQDIIQSYVILGGAGVIFLTLLQVTSNESQKLETVKMYMVDFLENTYAHRYEKIPKPNPEIYENDRQDEPVRIPVVEPEEVPIREPVKEPVPVREPVQEPIRGSVREPAFAPEPELQTVQAAKIREILEEFLT